MAMFDAHPEAVEVPEVKKRRSSARLQAEEGRRNRERIVENTIGDLARRLEHLEKQHAREGAAVALVLRSLTSMTNC